MNAGTCSGQRLFLEVCTHEELLELKLAHLLSPKRCPAFPSEGPSKKLILVPRVCNVCGVPSTCRGHPGLSVIWPGGWPPDTGCFSGEEGAALRLSLSAPLPRREPVRWRSQRHWRQFY